MKRILRVVLLLSIALALCMPTQAQEPQETKDNTSADQQTPSPSDQQTASPPDQQTPSSSVPANQSFPQGLLRSFDKTLNYGATFLQGYGSSRDTGVTTNQSFFALMPYVALNLRHDKFQLELQSTPVISYVPSQAANFGINGFLDPRFAFAIQISHKVTFQSSMATSYGDQYLHVMTLSTPTCEPSCFQSTQSLGSAATSRDLTAASFSIYGETGINWQRTPRQGFSLAAGKAYSTAPDQESRSVYSNATFARGQFIQSVTTLISVGGYTQVHYLQSPGFACASVGTGVVFQQQINRSTGWGAQGGTEIGDNGCGQRLGYTITGIFRRTLGQRSMLVLSGGHDQSSYFVPGSRWVNSGDAAYHRRMSGSVYLQLNGGYLNGTQAVDPNAQFTALYVTPSVLWKFKENFNLGAGYGHLSVTRPTNSSLARDWITISLTWHAKPRQL